MDVEKFLIQGIIFQDRQNFEKRGTEGITLNTYDGTGIVKALFHAVVTFKKESADSGMCGECKDQWGVSAISNFAISETEMSFHKTYVCRPAIEYVFRKQPDGLWYGSYKSPERISGTATCYVQPITDDFFIP